MQITSWSCVTRVTFLCWSPVVHMRGRWPALVAYCIASAWPVVRAPGAIAAMAVAGCVDRLPQCAGWAATGECEKNVEFMLASCRKACNKCPSNETGESLASPGRDHPLSSVEQNSQQPKPVQQPVSRDLQSPLQPPLQPQPQPQPQPLQQQQQQQQQQPPPPPQQQSQQLQPHHPHPHPHPPQLQPHQPSQPPSHLGVQQKLDSEPLASADEGLQLARAAGESALAAKLDGLPSGGVGGGLRAGGAGAGGARLVGNASAILAHARAGLTTALREVRSCRAGRAQCHEELDACRQGSDGVKALRSEEERCLGQLQRAREEVLSRTKEASEVKARADAISAAAQRQMATLKLQAKQSATTEESCRQRLAEVAAAEASQQQVQAQLGALRRKLEQKEQLEDAIEGKHSKLTEVRYPCPCSLA